MATRPRQGQHLAQPYEMIKTGQIQTMSKKEDLLPAAFLYFQLYFDTQVSKVKELTQTFLQL